MSVIFVLATALVVVVLAVVFNLSRQVFFKDPRRPPEVFHWLPVIGSTVEYGMDPYAFFSKCQAKYGDCFTFVLLGKKTTVFLTATGNQFILNGSSRDLNAEEVYGPLTTPVFGKGVIYDCPNAKLMDQKRLLIKGFSPRSLKTHVPAFVKEVELFLQTSPVFESDGAVCDISEVMAEITLYTAAGSLQGAEIREKMDSEVALLYRHLDDGFAPINFMLPWAPLPQNRRRDRAQKKMAQLYTNVIQQRRQQDSKSMEDNDDMISILMNSNYRDGSTIPDIEIAHLMIALLMGGQHNTSASSTWILLRLANQPHLIEELYQEQLEILGSPLPPLTYDTLKQLQLNSKVIKETLRLHSPIHSVMRKVTSPMPIESTSWVVPPTHTLLAAPNFLARSDEFFPNAMKWDPYRWQDSSSQKQANSGGEEKKRSLQTETIDFGYGPVSLKAANSPYLPFGAGRHRCVGEEYAYTQLGAIIATMVRLLQWEQVDKNAPVPETDYSSMFSRPMHPALIKWRHRR